MPTRRVLAPPRGAALLGASVYRERPPSVSLVPVRQAVARFGSELARLRAKADPAVAMTFSPDWWRAVPPPFGYTHRLLLLEHGGALQAAICLRERTILGLPTGLLYGGDAKGEGLVLCAPGQESMWLSVGIRSLFRSRRCAAMLLQQPEHSTYSSFTGSFGDNAGTSPATLQVHMQPANAFWRTALRPSFDQTLASLGHRTRRNLRYALRRATHIGWQFLPELTSAQEAEATEVLASRSTHPYGKAATAARLRLESTEQATFSMGLRDAEGRWLSLLSGIRRPEGVTDVFWQSNVAMEHGSVALCMRALLMRHEGERGALMLRWIGGTSPFLEHCCQPDPSTQILITRPGLRLAMLRRFLQTRFASAENPIRKLLRLEPAGA